MKFGFCLVMSVVWVCDWYDHCQTAAGVIERSKLLPRSRAPNEWKRTDSEIEFCWLLKLPTGVCQLKLLISTRHLIRMRGIAECRFPAIVWSHSVCVTLTYESQAVRRLHEQSVVLESFAVEVANWDAKVSIWLPRSIVESCEESN